jgi:hypothetical protein
MRCLRYAQRPPFNESDDEKDSPKLRESLYPPL